MCFIEEEGVYDVRDCVLIGVSQLRHIRGDSRTILRALTSPQGGPGADLEDSEMTEDIDWHDFMVVEQIDLYNDVEMTE